MPPSYDQEEVAWPVGEALRRGKKARVCSGAFQGEGGSEGPASLCCPSVITE